MWKMPAVHSVACNSHSRERRVLLDGRIRHILPYLDEMARSLDSQYDEFTCYISLRQEYMRSPPTKTALIPFLRKLATWSFIKDFSGNITNTIEVPSGTLCRLSNMTGRLPKHADFPYPVGKLMKTLLPPANEQIALSCSCLRQKCPV